MLKRNYLALVFVSACALAFSPENAFAIKHRPRATAVPAVNPAISRNWGLDNQERASHISAKKAWKIAKPKKEVIVAVIDTGIDPTHPMIKDHLWHEKGTGAYGFDFVTNKINPKDNHGHGTHVAGIVLAASGAETNKNSKVRVMPVRYFDESGSSKDHLDFTVKAIEYAVEHGAKIINFSTEGVGFNRAEYRAIQNAQAKGVLFVTAAGNQSQDNDTNSSPCYPASYELPNLITVAATNIRNELVPISNWGPKHVHVAAPGDHIFSSLPHGAYGYMTGTSQATAYVSGVAALLLSENPRLTPQELISILEKSSDPLPGLKTKVMAGGRINAYSALLEARIEAKAAKASSVAKNTSPSEAPFPLNLLGRSGENRDLTATP
ncbi:MAG: S8 family peptidase [Bdellovibrionota bacterium]